MISVCCGSGVNVKVAAGVAVDGTAVAVGNGAGVAVDVGVRVAVAVGDAGGSSVGAIVIQGVAGAKPGPQLINHTTKIMPWSRALILYRYAPVAIPSMCSHSATKRA